MNLLRSLAVLFILGPALTPVVAAEPLKVLFLGDRGHHQPQARAEQLIPVLSQAGIEVTYTDDVDRLALDNLKRYAGLIVYANIDEIRSEHEAALLEYVAGGGGFIPLHCASYCFRNSPAIIDLVGAQFQRHGGEVFTTDIVYPDHPLMRGFEGFESWDETYVHTKHNERNRVVLEVRRQGMQAPGETAEPWTWIRTHGQGRVFYTAWGHDARTFGHPGFHNLVQRGILWACGRDPAVVPAYRESHRFRVPEMTALRTDVAPFEYEEVGPKIPNYLAGERWGTQGEIITTMQKALSPDESLKHYVTPQNFHLELVVAEPDFQGKPIAMNWDHRGRMWVCETVDYPNELMPPEQGRDRIRICEDTDGDGLYDQFKVFAEQLSIPTSIEFYRDGIIVQAGVETLYLRDRDGDDRCDQREVLIAGWQMGDTHGGVSNFQYGLDNRYWAMQGYNNSKPTFAGGEHPGFRQGPFHFTVEGTSEKPYVSAVEFVRSTTNNSWGLGISEEGLIFASTANRAPSFFVPIPNRYYERVRGWTPTLVAEAIAPDHYFKPITDKVRQVDHHGGYTAGAGHALYTARNYPRDWWNQTAFVCGPTGHLVGTFLLQPEGANYRSQYAFNLIASDDEWSAPIMAEVGPDGNIWIIDWYNYIVQHNPTPQGFTTGKGNAYQSDLRDKTHGRIYRLVYDGAPERVGADGRPSLDADRVDQWVAALAHPNRLWRRHAQRLLVERGQADVVLDIVALLRDDSVDSTGNNVGAIHALWTLKGLGALEDTSSPAYQAAVRALSHASAGVRRNAALVLPAAEDSARALVEAHLLKDADAQVQLAALLALSDMPGQATIGVYLAEYAAIPSLLSDKYLKDGLTCAAAAHCQHFLTAVLSRPNSELAGPALEPLAEVVSVVADHMARSQWDPALLEDLLVRLKDASPSLRRALLRGLAAGWSRDGKTELSSRADLALTDLLEASDTSELGPLLKLGSLWGSSRLSAYADRLSKTLLMTIEDPSSSTDRRIAAANELVGLAGDDSRTVSHLLEIIHPQTPPPVSSGILRALGGATAENLGDAFIALWPATTPSQREDILSVLIARPGTTQQMLDAMEQGVIAVADLSLDQRQTLSTHPNSDIRRVANRLLRSVGSNIDADRQQVIERYAGATKQTGDAAVGKELFTKNCAICHKHSGEGKEIGPDLTGMAVHPKEELLVHILDPSRSVEGNFRRYTLLTVGGKVLTGMLAAESLAAVELIDAEGKTQSISRDDIEQITSSHKSMMPEGFEQQLNDVQMRDLLEFLTQKGRFVPLPLNPVATAVSTKGLFGNSDNGPDRMIFSDWSAKDFRGIPFQLIDPLGKKRANIILFNGPFGSLPPTMPRQVSLPCNMVVKSIHMLSGVSGWGYPYSPEATTSLTVRLRYADGQVEDHALKNGEHFADYIRRVDVPKSDFAFALGAQQIRYLAVEPQRQEPILAIDLVKGEDQTAPMVMAITVERFE